MQMQGSLYHLCSVPLAGQEMRSACGGNVDGNEGRKHCFPWKLLDLLNRMNGMDLLNRLNQLNPFDLLHPGGLLDGVGVPKNLSLPERQLK